MERNGEENKVWGMEIKVKEDEQKKPRMQGSYHMYSCES